MNQEQFDRIKNGKGFIAALDQSGGSTPKALKTYGVAEDQYTNEDEMFDLVHQMRTRIMTAPSFTGDKVLGAILFEQTMDRMVDGQYTADYLWSKKVVPFVKVDQGLAEEANGVQLMKPLDKLSALLDRANERGIFGTKMRSNILENNFEGIQAVVKQQFEVGKQIIAAGLVPIIEPEVNIHAQDKLEIEKTLKGEILKALDTLNKDQFVMLKLTLPSEANLYQELAEHPQVVRVVALSGGYSANEANDILSQNKDIIASFSRALSQDLRFDQSEDEFNQIIAAAIDSIYQASIKA